MNFGSTLRVLRTSREKSQAKLSVALGFDSSYISQVERSVFPPPRPVILENIVEILELTQEERDLLFAAATPQPAPALQP